MRHEPVRRALGLDLLGGLAKGQRLGLGKDIRQEHVVVPAQRSERLAKRDEVARNQPGALMNQLIERVLAVGAGFAPDKSGRCRSSPCLPVERDVLAVALHRQLLEIGGKPFQVLFVGQHRHGLRTEESRCTRRPAGP